MTVERPDDESRDGTDADALIDEVESLLVTLPMRLEDEGEMSMAEAIELVVVGAIR